LFAGLHRIAPLEIPLRNGYNRIKKNAGRWRYMVYTLDEIARRVRPVAEKYKLHAVYVFGSYARGEARVDSDVDLLVDTTGADLSGFFAIGGLYNDLEEALGKKIDVVTTDTLTQPCRRMSDQLFHEMVNRERRELYVVA